MAEDWVQLGRARALALLVALAIAGCAGNGEGLDENGRPIGETPPLPGGDVGFAKLQDEIFTPICTACHAGGAAPLGLRLEAGLSYAMLVNVASVEVPELLRVAPGNPDASYLVHKIEGRAAVGAQMPLGGPALSQSVIDDVRTWISTGALPSATQVVSSQPAILTASAPMDGEEVLAPIDRVLVVFSRDLDATLLNSASVALRRIDVNDAASAGEEIATDVRVPSSYPASAWIRSRAPLLPGDYELVLRASGAGGLADLSGTLIDGDGDGIAGGDVRVRFRVTEHRQ